jgi:hypothetical protein
MRAATQQTNSLALWLAHPAPCPFSASCPRPLLVHAAGSTSASAPGCRHVDTIRVHKSQLLGDHSAHGSTHNIRSFNARRSEHRGGIARHLLDSVRSGRRVAAADTAIVVQNHPVRRRQTREHAVPHLVAEAEAHNQQNRRSRTVFFPVNAGSFVRCVRHGAYTPIYRCSAAAEYKNQ